MMIGNPEFWTDEVYEALAAERKSRYKADIESSINWCKLEIQRKKALVEEYQRQLETFEEDWPEIDRRMGVQMLADWRAAKALVGMEDD